MGRIVKRILKGIVDSWEMEKEILIENVNKWVSLDDEIIALQREMRELKKKKTDITNILVDVMRKNDVDSFDMKDNSLLYKISYISV